MKVSLIKGLTESQKRELIQEFSSSLLFRKQLIQIMKEKMQTNSSYLRSKERYNSPSWNLLQADGIGYERALNEVISIISEKVV